MMLGLWASLALIAAEPLEAPPSQATASMMAFVELYQNRDFASQWRLVDPRMRYWIDLSRWTKAMVQGQRRHGDLRAFDLVAARSVKAEQLPCTEMGHCYRRNVSYALFIVRTRYSRKDVAQPEFIVMAQSDEGWRFAGGTFPGTPMGETAVLLDEADEAKYRAIQRSIRR